MEREQSKDCALFSQHTRILEQRGSTIPRIFCPHTKICKIFIESLKNKTHQARTHYSRSLLTFQKEKVKLQ